MCQPFSIQLAGNPSVVHGSSVKPTKAKQPKIIIPNKNIFIISLLKINLFFILAYNCKVSTFFVQFLVSRTK